MENNHLNASNKRIQTNNCWFGAVICEYNRGRQLSGSINPDTMQVITPKTFKDERLSFMQQHQQAQYQQLFMQNMVPVNTYAVL